MTGRPRLVTVDIHQRTEAFRHLEGNLHIPHTVLPGEFVVWNPSHHIGPHLHGPDHQILPLGKCKDTVLGEGHNLYIHQVFHLILNFEQGFHGEQRRVSGIGVGAYSETAVCHLPLDGLKGVFLEDFLGQMGLSLPPYGNPFQ